MSEMTVSEARAKLADVVDHARTRHEPVLLTRHGKRARRTLVVIHDHPGLWRCENDVSAAILHA
jgi:prevent-host-death family protein